MARAQETNVTGGEINPYVQQSLAQNKQLANNRLLTAMQEQGATQRTAMTTSAQLKGQAMQNQTQLQVEAARAAQEDKRAAEGERARREEMDLRSAELQITEEFHNKSLALQQKQLDAVISGQEEDARLTAEHQAYQDLLDSETLSQKEVFINGLLSVMQVGQKNELGLEKAKTTMFETKKQYQNNLRSFDTSKEGARNYIENDRTMGLPPGYVGVTPTGISSVPVGEEIQEQGKVANPFQTLQRAISQNGSKVDVSSILGDVRGAELEKRIATGKVDSADITELMAGIDPMLEILDDKISTAKGKDVQTWKYYRGMIGQVKNTVKNLSRSNTLVQGNEHDTVGARVTAGLAPTDVRFSPDFNAVVYRAMEQNGNDVNAAIKQLSGAREPFKLYEIPKGASDAMIAAINRRNEILKKASPEKFPATEPGMVPSD
jgi:hypothetical protein